MGKVPTSRNGTDAQYAFSKILPDFAAWTAWYPRESAAARADVGEPEVVRVGPEAMPAYRFVPGTRPTGFVYIHGGYWRAFAASDYDFALRVARAVNAPFYNVDYRLMPAVRMADVVDDVARTVAAIAARHRAAGGRRLVIAGHSAGAHLAVYALAQDIGVARDGVLVSGVFDLAPLTGSFLQDEIALTPDEVARFSPGVSGPVPATPQQVVTGADETDAIQRQSDGYLQRAVAAGVAATRHRIPGTHHMSVVAQLGQPDTPLWRLVTDRLLAP